MGRPQTSMWWKKIGSAISAQSFPIEEQEIPASHQAPQPGVLVPGREAFTASGYEKLWGF